MADSKVWGLCLFLTIFSSDVAYSINASAEQQPLGARRPVDAVELQGEIVAIANRQSGSIALVDLQKKQILSDTKVGESIVALHKIDDSKFLALDHRKHQVLLCSLVPEGVSVRARLDVSPFPVGLDLSRDQSWCAVSSLWSRTSSIISLKPNDQETEMRFVASLDLGFEPRCVTIVEELERIFVADAFGGNIVAIEYSSDPDSSIPADLSVAEAFESTGNNLLGLSIQLMDGKPSLLFVESLTSRLAQPMRDEVHWGNYVSSSVSSISLARFLVTPDGKTRSPTRITLGDVGRGAADPSSLAIDSKSRLLVASSGSNSVAVYDAFGEFLSSTAVGAAPSKLLLTGAGQVMVLNELDDTISTVEIADSEGGVTVETEDTIRLREETPLNARQRGELLFRSAQLSHGGWMTCHTCHPGGHSSGKLIDTQSDGGVGAPKRVLSLLGVNDTKPVSWLGTVELEEQLQNSVVSTMHGANLSETQIKDLNAYLEALPLPPKSLPHDTAFVEQGKRIFDDRQCRRCHQPPTYTNEKRFDVSMSDDLGNRRFNPPSLRGLRYRRSFFHDGRAQNLTQVFSKYQHPGKVKLSDSEIDSLVQFLLTL